MAKIIWVVGVVAFVFNIRLVRPFFIKALLCLEGRIILVIVGVGLNLSHWGVNDIVLLFIVLLVFSVCEARIGLGLLVASARHNGEDNIKISCRLKY